MFDPNVVKQLASRKVWTIFSGLVSCSTVPSRELQMGRRAKSKGAHNTVSVIFMDLPFKDTITMVALIFHNL